jgi:type VI secretion system protein VasG
VDVNTVAEVITTWTGIPLDRLMRGTFDAVNELEAELERRVVGQTIATKQIAKSLTVAAARLSEPGRPMGVFLLAGPTGVGKSETARALADLMFGGSANMVLINMSEYQEPHSISGLKGAPPGYVGYGTGGVLTEAVRRTPYNVVLLDEFEKAHPDVWELFFQIFDAGTLEDSEGERVDFSNTIILATTNIGDDAILNTVYGEGADLNTLMERLNAKLAETFHAALLGRMVAVPYLPLDKEEIKKIVDLRISRMTDQISEAYNAEFKISSAAREHIAALSFSTGGAGAREINRVVEGQVLPSVASSVLNVISEGQEIFSIEVDLSNNQFTVDVKQRVE